jgi:NTE family protein
MGSCEVLSVSNDRIQPKTAFVFAGGGSFGAVQVGMLQALASHGIVADMVFGSSVGAFNGAYYAGAPTIEGIRELASIWRGLRRKDVFPLTWRALLGFARRRDFLVASDSLQQLVDTHLSYRNLEDAKIPIHVIATDIISGETVVLSKGSCAKAIMASAALPAIFAPVQFEKLYLVDGAISSNTPVKVAVALGAERLIILPTGYACARHSAPAGAMANALHALTLLIARQLISELDGLDPKIDYFVVPPLCPLRGSPYDFSQTSELISRAVESTNAWLADGGLERPRVHTQLGLHKHSH